MKVGFFGNVKKEMLEEVEALGYTAKQVSKKDIKEKNYDRDFDIICGSLLFNLVNLEEFEKLKYIFLFSQGVDYMPLDYLKEKGITLTNNKGAYAEPIGEFIVYSLLAMEKMAKTNIKNQENKKWAPRATTGNLYNKKALFLGTGDIAQEGAKRLSGFNMEIVGYNTNGREVEHFNRCVDLEHLDQELKTSEIVVMVLPSTEKTKEFLDDERFSKLKDGVTFVNIARGDVVDEKALIKHLQNGKIKYAALDVFEKEPLSEDSPLWDMENVYITPHISGTAEDTEERFFRNAWANLHALAENKELVNIVDLEKKY